MRKLALVLLFSPVLTSAAMAQAADDGSCRAPVSVENRKCSDALATGAPADRQQGTMEQRDDGYYVFVPRQGD